jgi:TetR/AcrR family transcriptional regulator, transcriptional repressor of bet genes
VHSARLRIAGTAVNRSGPWAEQSSHGLRLMSSANHEARRRRIADIVLRVITEDGLEAATVRRIAAEVGYSTAVVTHYFADKRDLLLSAFRSLGERNRVKFDACMASDPPDLPGYLMAMTALDEVDGSAWRACIAFWDRSLRDPLFAAELRGWVGEVLARIEQFILAVHPHCPAPRRIATQLFDMVQGMSTHLLFDTDCWTVDTARTALDAQIALLINPLQK